MAPEQFLSPPIHSHQSDLYALGITATELLSGNVKVLSEPELRGLGASKELSKTILSLTSDYGLRKEQDAKAITRILSPQNRHLWLWPTVVAPFIALTIFSITLANRNQEVPMLRPPSDVEQFSKIKSQLSDAQSSLSEANTLRTEFMKFGEDQRKKERMAFTGKTSVARSAIKNKGRAKAQNVIESVDSALDEIAKIQAKPVADFFYAQAYRLRVQAREVLDEDRLKDLKFFFGHFKDWRETSFVPEGEKLDEYQELLEGAFQSSKNNVNNANYWGQFELGNRSFTHSTKELSQELAP
jgi:hypothetical protein